MGAVLRSWSHAFGSQWHPRLLAMSVLPFLLALALWAVLLYLGLQPLIDYLHALFTEYDGFSRSSSLLTALGLATLKTVVVPLIAMLALLPLMIMTALVFIGLVAMPLIGRHVGRRSFPQLEQRKGGSLLGSVGTAAGAMLIFIGLWLVTLPLYAFPPLAVATQALLWGWLTMRVMVYDALADYATPDERREILQRHRGRLLLIGVISGVAGLARRAVAGRRDGGGAVSVSGRCLDLAVCADFYLHRPVVCVLLSGSAGAIACRRTCRAGRMKNRF